MTQTIEAPQRPGRRLGWRTLALRKEALGVLLLGLVAVFVLWGAWVGPRPDSPPPESMPSEGYVLSLNAADGLSSVRPWSTGELIDRLRPAPEGNVLVWTEAGRVRWATLSPSDPMLKEYRARPVSSTGLQPAEALHRPMVVGVLMSLLSLWAVVAGPRPRYGTRWFWFWLLPASLGLCIAWYAVAELIRTPDDRRPRRRSGLDGFVTGLVISAGVGAMLWLLQGL